MSGHFFLLSLRMHVEGGGRGRGEAREEGRKEEESPGDPAVEGHIICLEGGREGGRRSDFF